MVDAEQELVTTESSTYGPEAAVAIAAAFQIVAVDYCFSVVVVLRCVGAKLLIGMRMGAMKHIGFRHAKVA